MVQPVQDRVLIQIKEAEEKTQGGIYLPESASDASVIEGTVKAIGKLEKDSVAVGDKVLVEKHVGTEVTIEGKKHLIVKEEFILAKA